MLRLIAPLMLAATAVIGLGSPADADIIINNVGLSNPADLITFSEISLPSETPVTNQYGGLGVTFLPGLFYNTQPIFFPTPSLADFDSAGHINNPVTIDFNQEVTGAALAVQTNPGTSTFTALLNGVIVEQFTASTTLSVLPDLSQSSNFYGFTNIAFNELQILSNTTFFQMDNLQFTPVPEPSSLALVLIALVVGGGWRQRRRLLK